MNKPSPEADVDDEPVSDEISITELAEVLAARWKLLVAAPILAGAIGVGVSYLIAPSYTAVATLMPPQQSQSAAAAALASLGPLAGLGGGGSAALRNSGEQLVALMQSVRVADRIIEQFKLMEIYDKKLKVDARLELARNVAISLGKKDGLITVAVDDSSPKRAAEIANQYVDELHRMTAQFAVTEAQQRRMFFEQQMQLSRDRLVAAQAALQTSGFNAGALKAEPRAAAESYARLRAEATAVEVRLQALRSAMTDNTPEIRNLQSSLSAIRQQLARASQSAEEGGGPDYISRYREFKYQETLFELYAKQFELARVDESREGALIQVVDTATPPERKSKPKRSLFALAAALAGFLGVTGTVLIRHLRRKATTARRVSSNATVCSTAESAEPRPEPMANPLSQRSEPPV